MYGSSDSEAAAKKSLLLSATVAGVSCLPRVLWQGIEDGCSWCRYNLNAPRLYSISLHPNAKENKHHITKEKNIRWIKRMPDARFPPEWIYCGIHQGLCSVNIQGTCPVFQNSLPLYAFPWPLHLIWVFSLYFPCQPWNMSRLTLTFLNVAPMAWHLQNMEE